MPSTEQSGLGHILVVVKRDLSVAMAIVIGGGGSGVGENSNRTVDRRTGSKIILN